MTMAVKFTKFIFDLLQTHLPHDDETDEARKPLTNWEYVIALVVVAAFMILLLWGFQVLITKIFKV
jgi:hypothetical protein